MTADTPGGSRVVRTVFVHIEEIEVTCPLCGAVMRRFFHREKPSEGFHPPLVACECGRYSYGHHN